MNATDSTSPWIDPDDAPELDDAMFDKADVYQGNRLVRPGRLSVNPGLDLDVLVALVRIG